ncbi:calcium-binding protein [Rhizobium sp.]
MAKHVIKSDRDMVYSIPAPGTWEFTKNSDIEVTEGYAIDAGGIPKIKMSVAGTAITHDDGTAAIYSTGSKFELTIKKGALVSGGNGVYVTGSAHIINAGEIAGVAQGLFVNNGASKVENSGSIYSANNSAALVTGIGVEFINRGKLDGNVGLYFEDVESRGTNLKSGKILGEVIAVQVQGRGGWAGGDGGEPPPDGVRFVNHGLLQAPTAFESGAFFGTHLVNDGMMKGNVQLSYRFSQDTFINTGGTVKGDVMLRDGNDILDTRGGVITGTIYGGDGSDTLKTDNAKYRLVEQSGAPGTDTVMSSVSYTLSDNVERLILLGTKNINGTGTNGYDELKGNSGNNNLKGLGGQDILQGGKGNDRLSGGDFQSDRFIFSTGDGKDVITDFKVDDGNLNFTDVMAIGGWKAIKDFDDLIENHLKEVDGNAVIFAGKDSVTFDGISADALKNQAYFDFS